MKYPLGTAIAVLNTDKSNSMLPAEKEFENILEKLPDIESQLHEMREVILGNLVMVGEIPSPTFKESERVDFITNRFSELGMLNASTDEVGNGVGILEGEEGEDNILLVAHADTIFSEKTDHTITVHTDRVVGAGVADDGLGLAVLASLPTVLDRLNIKLKNDLILMAATRSLGRGNLEGLRFFLSNNKIPIKAGVCVEGVQLGRLSHLSIGMLRGEIKCNVPDEYDWTRFGDASAILTLNEVINKINDIPLPKRPRTSIVLGSVEGGSSFNQIATTALLRFEIRSESKEMVTEIGYRMEEIVAEVSSRTGDHINLDIFAKREPGGISFSHPLARKTRFIMDALDIKPRIAPSTSELAAFIDSKIPAVTLGITEGDKLQGVNETIKIDPMYKGLTQLIATILAIDGGYCEQ